MKSLRFVHAKTRRAYNLAAQMYHDLLHSEMAEKEYDRNLIDAFAAKFPKGVLVCDAGCGPSTHIGRYLFEKGLRVVGVDVSDRCVELARAYNPAMEIERGDIARLSFCVSAEVTQTGVNRASGGSVSERGAASARRAAASDSGGYVNSRAADERTPL